MRFFTWLRGWTRPRQPSRPSRGPAFRFAPRLEQLEGRDLPSATFLKDAIGGIFSPGSPLCDVKGTLFFSASDSVHDYYLSKTDGTVEGTVPVKDIQPFNLTNVDGTLFFTAISTTATGSSNGLNLWKSDGTTDGTTLVKHMMATGVGESLTNVNGRLFFLAYDGTPGDGGLWASDGTVEGTVPVYAGKFPSRLMGSNGSLFFVEQFISAQGVFRFALWRLSQFVRDDAVKTPEGTPVQINVLANDFLGAGAAITATTPAAHGSAVLNADGSFTYTPGPGFSGVDTFTYTVTNRFGDMDTATVTVRVIQPVQIDIKPGDKTNVLNLNNDGTLSVALFSTADFDARTVDLLSVRFAGAAAIQSSLEDVNHDGTLDLVVQFRIDDTNLRDVYRQLLLADAADGTLSTTREQTTLLLSGGTTGGGLWEGLDAATLFESGKVLADLLTALGLK